MRYQALYNDGGIYLDFKSEGLKPFDPFLKYEIFFANCDYTNYYRDSRYVGNGVIGSTPHNYHLGYVLNRYISEDTFDYQVSQTPRIVGGYVLRAAFTE